MSWWNEPIVLRLDEGRNQRQITDSKGNERVEGECGYCGSYGDPELDIHYLKTSKFGYIIKHNSCHTCWVKIPVLN